MNRQERYRPQLTMLALVVLLGRTTDGAEVPNQVFCLEEIDQISAETTKTRNACGPLSAWYCLRRLGHPQRPDEILAAVEIAEDGVAVGELMKLLDQLGRPGRLVKLNPEQVERLPSPAILLLRDAHCVAYDGRRSEDGAPLIFEPTTCTVGPEPMTGLQVQWTGEAIVFGRPYPSLATRLLLLLGTGAIACSVSMRLLAGRRERGAG